MDKVEAHLCPHLDNGTRLGCKEFCFNFHRNIDWLDSLPEIICPSHQSINITFSFCISQAMDGRLHMETFFLRLLLLLHLSLLSSQIIYKREKMISFFLVKVEVGGVLLCACVYMYVVLLFVNVIIAY